MSTIKVDTIATRTGSGDITSSNNVSLADNTRVKLGTGDDIQIYHDGSYSRIMESGGTGLVLDTTSTDTRITSDNSKVMGKFIKDGAVQLFHNNSQKLSTASTGINITGGIGLGGTGSANILDDYEEGTFTATAGNSVTLHSNYDRLKYTKIGNLVTITGQVRVNNDNSNAGFRITNFPFVHVGNTEGEGHTFGAVRLYSWDVPSAALYVGCFMAPSSSTAYVEYVQDNGATAELPSDSDAYIMFGYTYPTSQ